MPIARHRLTLATSTPVAMLDLTDAVRAWVRGTGLRDGLLTVTSCHTTARINVNEAEPELRQDMIAFLERLAPRGAGYRHDRSPLDGRINAHAHLLGLLMSTSESVPVQDGELVLGTWQRIFLVELDGPRPAREVALQLMGEPSA